MIEKPFQWHKAAASVIAVTLGLWLCDASALSLGRMTVLSALGEPLRAEIDVPAITSEEGASLSVSIAPPAAFGAAGMEYHPALAAAQITLMKRNDGRSFLRLSSDRPVNDAFLDIILEANWASGRIVRDFTVLLDPPNLRQTGPSAPVAAQLPAIATAAPPVPASATVTTPAPPAMPTPMVPPALARNTPAVAMPPAFVASAPPRPVGNAGSAGSGTASAAQQVRVKPGDTAGRIAATHKPAQVSLDQMLAALLRSNPHAFIANDLNRIKAGAVLALPQQDLADSGQSPSTLVAQSKDFNDYRGKVAATAPKATLVPADRQASGKVQSQVQDEKHASAPDKLTLTKGGVKADNSEAELAKQRSLQEAAEKAAALARNIEELSKLKADPGAPAPAHVASSASASVSAASTSPSEGPVAVASPARLPASAPLPAPASAADNGVLATLAEDPATPTLAAALIALLAALGVYRVRQRKLAQVHEEPSFLASRLKPDSFFSVPAEEPALAVDSPETGSSLLNPSSLAKAAGESDPLAEAEVYLAYGRDVQAEEVLREALRVRPELPGIHQKLLEILAKRRDVEGFEGIAREVHELTAGQGPQWDQVRDLGMIIDPDNPLYRDALLEITPDLTTQVDELRTSPSPTGPAATSDVDIDLNLDFSLDEGVPASAANVPPNASDGSADLSPETTPEPGALAIRDESLEPEIEFDLNLGDPGADTDPVSDQLSAPTADIELPELRFDTADLTLKATPSLPEQSRELESADDGPITNPGVLEFDFGSLSLELDKPDSTPEAPQAAPAEDPMATKLALAEEFVAIGDLDGARALMEEVIDQSSGDLQARARQALKAL